MVLLRFRLTLRHQCVKILQLLLKLDDSRLIETVGIPVEDKNNKGSVRLTACISSQVFFNLIIQRHGFCDILYDLGKIFNTMSTQKVNKLPCKHLQ